MEVYDKREVKEVREFYVKTICDWCTEDVEKTGIYERNDFELEWTYGDCYPEGGSWEGKKVAIVFHSDDKVNVFETKMKKEWDDDSAKKII